MEHDEQRTYSIGELADEVGVSTRTIRYYVSEGLLPPPVGSGPGSRYTDAHRKQLIAINALKEQYLPLKEIRKRLIGFNLPPTGSIGEESMRGVADAALPEALAFRSSPPGYTSRRNRAESRLPAAISMDFDNWLEPQPAESQTPPDPVESHSWRRVSISDEAELLITESQYRRHQDRIDWLVQWVKRVLEP